MRRKLAILALIIATTILSIKSINATTQTPTKFALTNKYIITVQVFLNNQGPFDFLFDTGSTMTAIEPSLATHLKLVQTQGATVVTASSKTNTAYSLLNTISFNDVTVPMVGCLISDLAQLQILNRKIRGVLGGNFLSHFNYLIDYKTQTITVEQGDELGATLSGFLLPSVFNANRNIIQASIPGSPSTVHFALDSAISNIVLFQRRDRPFTLPV